MPVRALVAAGALFGVGENNLRVSLARLYASGRVERDERGCYRLGANTEAVRRQIASWRNLSRRLRPWDGTWIGVHTATRKAAGRSARALRFLGFRSLSRGLELRPDNLVGGLSGVRDQLAALGLESDRLVFKVSELEPDQDQRGRDLWDAGAILRTYATLGRELEESRERLPRLAVEQAMVESFLVGGRVIRQLVLDPLLPEEIVSFAPREALVSVMRGYDRLGRGFWSAFLESFGVPNLRTPADLRVAEAAALIPNAYGEAA